MPIIEPRMLGLLPDDKTKSTFWVADDSNVERRVFDTNGNLFTPDGSTVDDRLNAVEAGIPPLDDARIVALEDAMLIAQGDIAVIEGDIVIAEGDIDALEVTVGAEQLLLDQAQADIVNLQGDVVTLTADVITANNNSTSAVNSVNAHIADVANPHVVTRAQIGAEAAGTAASAIVTHVALADPHAQYLKESATASEVESLPLNDANNYFTGATIGDQMQEAGAHMASTANPHSVSFSQVTPNSTQVEDLPLIDAGGYYGVTPTVGEALQQLGSDMTNVYEGNEGAAGQVLMSNGSGLASYENGDNIPMSDTGNYFAGNDKLGTQIQSVGASLAEITKKHDRIYGAYWDTLSTPTLVRTDDAVGFTARAGVDSILAFNQFDSTPIFDFEEVTDSYGNVFVRIPKMYIKKVVGDGWRSWQVSRKQHDGFYLPQCFWDFTNGVELDYIDVGKHIGVLSDDGTKLESKPNKYPLVNKNIVEFRNLAKANGIGYQQYDIHVNDLITTLFYIEFATLNSQSICAGYTSGQYSASHVATVGESSVKRIIIANAIADLYAVGQSISVGTSLGGNQIFYGRTITSIDVYDGSNKAINFDGAPINIAIGNIVYNSGYKTGFSSTIKSSVGSINSNSTGKHSFVWHGIESIFGDCWCFVDGVNINERQTWICEDSDDYASNVFAVPYKQLGYVNGNTNGYTIEMGHDADHPFANLPTTIGGDNATYYSDYYYQTTGQRVALVGGYWLKWSNAGLSSWDLDIASSSAYVSIGGRLLRKPL